MTQQCQRCLKFEFLVNSKNRESGKNADGNSENGGGHQQNMEKFSNVVADYVGMGVIGG